MAKKFLLITLFGLFALYGCGTTETTTEGSENLKEFRERFSKMGFRGIRDSAGLRN